MTTISTQELIRRYQAGQTDLFDAIFDRYKDYVYRVAYSYAQNAAEAQDVTQEAFLDVLKALPRYDLDGPARFETWLYRVTANRCKMRFRRKRPAAVEWDEAVFHAVGETLLELPGEHSDPGPEKSAQQAETRRALWQAVGQLKDIYREVILLRYGQDFSYDEIAGALKINLGTVKSRLNAAHRLLQELLSGDDEPDDQHTGHQRSNPLHLILLWLLGKLYVPARVW